MLALAWGSDGVKNILPFPGFCRMCKFILFIWEYSINLFSSYFCQYWRNIRVLRLYKGIRYNLVSQSKFEALRFAQEWGEKFTLLKIGQGLWLGPLHMEWAICTFLSTKWGLKSYLLIFFCVVMKKFAALSGALASGLYKNVIVRSVHVMVSEIRPFTCKTTEIVLGSSMQGRGAALVIATLHWTELFLLLLHYKIHEILAWLTDYLGTRPRSRYDLACSSRSGLSLDFEEVSCLMPFITGSTKSYLYSNSLVRFCKFKGVPKPAAHTKPRASGT